MKGLFDIVGDSFFKPLTSQLKTIYLDCLGIIYDTYRSELSYGADREILILKMTDYFDNIGILDIQFEDDAETLQDSRAKASAFLRKLKEFGWVEYEITNNQMQRIVMPNHAVTLLQTFSNIIKNDEMEYQGEISAIYSMITNKELLERPYPQLLKPVYARTFELFTGLKKLNTSIRKYIDNLTSEKTPEQILHDFFEYHDEIDKKHSKYIHNAVERAKFLLMSSNIKCN